MRVRTAAILGVVHLIDVDSRGRGGLEVLLHDHDFVAWLKNHVGGPKGRGGALLVGGGDGGAEDKGKGNEFELHDGDVASLGCLFEDE